MLIPAIVERAVPRTKRRQAGFSFIEILVVMAIISVLVSMVVFLVPMIQEKAKKTKSTDNVNGLLKFYIAAGAGIEKAWPPFNGKNFVLWLVATGKIDKRDDKQLRILFSPGDTKYTWDQLQTGLKEYEKVTKDRLATSSEDWLQLTSYAGRRNHDQGHTLTSDELSKGAICICDDDDGDLHHKDGLVCGYTSGQSRFVEWDDFDISKPDPKHPEGLLGDNSPNEDLKHMSSQN
jgi:prepilin-type N-terminal cleavage/methylation domain-containing protein